jgi:WD40 repeat protein
MTSPGYQNLDLRIIRHDKGYRAFVDSPEGEAEVGFELPFGPGEVTPIGGMLGVRRDLLVAGDADDAPDLADLGDRLYRAIFTGGTRDRLAASLASVDQGYQDGLRIRFRFEKDASDLAGLPWETLYDADSSQFLGLGERSPILRYLSLPHPRPALRIAPPLAVLVVLSSPEGLPPLDIEGEWQGIQAALAGLVRNGKLVLEPLAEPSLESLRNRLENGKPVHILHFAGHGTFDTTGQAGSVMLETKPVSGEQLGVILRNHPSLRLVFLNTCQGATPSEGSVFTGVAQALVRQGVPAAVAMQAPISDDAAIALADRFYVAVASGLPVDVALTRARVALRSAGDPGWAIPVLFSRSLDNRLFDIREVLPAPECPYPGLAPFAEAEADRFFGRDEEIADALGRLKLHSFLAVVGGSGSGKSSLISAGIIPALRQSGASVRVMRPGSRPHEALADSLAVAREPAPGGPGDADRILLFVDQFEELFTLAEASSAQAFLDAIASAMDRPGLTIILAVRADFYPELMACPLWPEIRANRLELTPLGDEELWAAIVKPAEAVGMAVDDTLAVRLVDDASGEIGVLPLLQETLVLLWDHVENRQLKRDAYQKIAPGSRNVMQVAIDRRAEVVYQNLPAEAQVIARRIFVRLVQFGEGRLDTRRQQAVDELRASGDDEDVFGQTLSTLIEQRLLTGGGDAEGGARQVDIAHEALITAWARLQDWLKERRLAEQYRRRLEEKADDWLRSGRKSGLLDDFALREAENWLADAAAQDLGYSRDLTDLVSASKAALAAAEAEKETQRRKELEQAQALAAERGRVAEEQRRRAEAAQRLGQGTLALGLASRAIEMAESLRDPDDLAALLAYQAYAFSSRSGRFAADRVDRALRMALGLTHFGPTLPTQQEVSAVAFESAGRWLASGTVNGVIEIWDLADCTAIRTFLRGRRASPRGTLKGAGEVHWLWLAPGGRAVAAISGDGDVQVWDDWARPSRPARLASAVRLSAPPTFRYPSGPSFGVASRPPFAVAVSHDQASFAYLGHDGPIWHFAADGTTRRLAIAGSCRALAFTPDDQALVLVSDYEPVVAIRKLDPPDSEPELVHLTDWVSETTDRGATLKPIIALGPDGRALVQCVKYRTSSAPVELWDLGGSDTPAPRPLRDGTLYAMNNDLTMQFGPRSEALAIATLSPGPPTPDREPGVIRLWDVRRPGKKPVLMRGSARCLAFSAAGDLLAGGSSAVRLWRLRTADDTATVLGEHRGPVRAVGFSPDSRTLVSCGEDEVIRCWDLRRVDDDPVTMDVRAWQARLAFHSLRRREFYQPYPDPVPVPFPVTFSPDGRSVALAVVMQDQDRECPCVVDLMYRDHPMVFPSPPVPNRSGSPEERFLNVFSVAFGTGGRSVICVEFDEYSYRNMSGSVGPARGGFARRWDLDRPDVVHDPICQLSGVDPIMALGPGGEFLVSAPTDQVVASGQGPRWETTVRLWDLSQPGEDPVALGQARSAPSAMPVPSALAVRPDGQMLALGIENGEITLWDTRQPSPGPVVLHGHGDRVAAVAFSPDGQMLASGSDDLTVRLWDLRQPTSYPVVLAGHEAGVSSVAFSADGRLLASGGNDGTVRLSIAHAEVLSGLVRDRLTRSLTQEEWTQFMGDGFGYEAITR